jgi:hypothetical protein
MPGLTILHGCRTIQLTRGRNALIDEPDHAVVDRFKWHTHASKGYTYYAMSHERVEVGKWKGLSLHRTLMNAPAGQEVDHVNGDGLDNRRANLRVVTHKQNGSNRRKLRGESRFKGVHRYKSGWRTCIYIDQKRTHLGCFATEIDAARAYDAAARKHYAEFAKTNTDLFGDY